MEEELFPGADLGGLAVQVTVFDKDNLSSVPDSTTTIARTRKKVRVSDTSGELRVVHPGEEGYADGRDIMGHFKAVEKRSVGRPSDPMHRGWPTFKITPVSALVPVKLEKEAPGQAVLWTKAIRQGLGCRIRLGVDLIAGTITEVARLEEDEGNSGSSVVVF